jgi:hypothetical protein
MISCVALAFRVASVSELAFLARSFEKGFRRIFADGYLGLASAFVSFLAWFACIYGRTGISIDAFTTFFQSFTFPSCR